MRFNSITTLAFTDITGAIYQVKDIRPVSTFQQGLSIPYQQGTTLSELISRQENYGKNSEDLSWAVVDANIENLAENNFNFAKVRQLYIPVVGAF